MKKKSSLVILSATLIAIGAVSGVVYGLAEDERMYRIEHWHAKYPGACCDEDRINWDLWK